MTKIILLATLLVAACTSSEPTSCGTQPVSPAYTLTDGADQTVVLPGSDWQAIDSYMHAAQGWTECESDLVAPSEDAPKTPHYSVKNGPNQDVTLSESDWTAIEDYFLAVTIWTENNVPN